MQRKGREGEKEAAEYLEEKGFRILEENYHCGVGEVDLVALEGDYLVFVEVKKRKEESLVSPEEAVTREKRRKIVFCSKCWIMEHSYRGDVRYDVVAISGERMRHYKGAFSVEGKGDKQ